MGFASHLRGKLLNLPGLPGSAGCRLGGRDGWMASSGGRNEGFPPQDSADHPAPLSRGRNCLYLAGPAGEG